MVYGRMPSEHALLRHLIAEVQREEFCNEEFDRYFPSLTRNDDESNLENLHLAVGDGRTDSQPTSEILQLAGVQSALQVSAANPNSTQLPTHNQDSADHEEMSPDSIRQSNYPGNVCCRTNKRKKGTLWQFFLELLRSDKTCPSIIKWEDGSVGIFRIIDTGEVARLWGQRKSNPSMTYEKLSRGMRYYYDLAILKRVKRPKLLYQFVNLDRIRE